MYSKTNPSSLSHHKYQQKPVSQPKAHLQQNDDSQHCALCLGARLDRPAVKRTLISEKSTILDRSFSARRQRILSGAAGQKSCSMADLPLPIFAPNDALASERPDGRTATALPSATVRRRRLPTFPPSPSLLLRRDRRRRDGRRQQRRRRGAGDHAPQLVCSQPQLHNFAKQKSHWTLQFVTHLKCH